MTASLRTRLTLAIVLVTGPAVTAMVVLLYFAVSAALWDEFDRETRRAGGIFASLVEWDHEDGYEIEGGRAISALLASGPSPTHVEVRAPMGTLLQDPVVADLIDPPLSDTPVTLTARDGRELRGLRLEAEPRLDEDLDRPDEGPIVVTVLRETAATRHTLATIAAWFWILGAGTVVLATAVAGVAVHRGMRPLHRLARQLDRIDGPDAALGLEADELPRELRPIARKLDALLERLKRAFDNERRFTADVAHELRTPLSVMRSELDVALQGVRDPSDYRRRIETLRETVDRMAAMAERLLLLARADAGRLPVGKIALPLLPLVAECWAPFQAEAARRRVEFDNRVDPEATLEGDEDSIRMIVTNLLANAAAYTAAGGWIRVEAGDRSLAVVDSGPPIPGDPERAFERFWRSDQARSETGTHSGIGLALARALARCQGLEVRLDNRPDGTVAARIEAPQGPGS